MCMSTFRFNSWWSFQITWRYKTWHPHGTATHGMTRNSLFFYCIIVSFDNSKENFANPCSVEGRQYNPADASFGPHYFIECNWNTPYLFKCPANLVWNQQIETCDWPYTPSYGSYAPAPAPYAPAPAQYAPAPAQYAPVPAAQPSYRSNY